MQSSIPPLLSGCPTAHNLNPMGEFALSHTYIPSLDMSFKPIQARTIFSFLQNNNKPIKELSTLFCFGKTALNSFVHFLKQAKIYFEELTITGNAKMNIHWMIQWLLGNRHIFCNDHGLDTNCNSS